MSELRYYYKAWDKGFIVYFNGDEPENERELCFCRDEENGKVIADAMNQVYDKKMAEVFS